VLIVPAPIGQVIDTLQELLNGFLGVPRRKQTEQSVILTYRMESEGPPVVQMRLKVEINTREHFADCLALEEIYLQLRRPLGQILRASNGKELVVMAT
jgi:hypothetical protein